MKICVLQSSYEGVGHAFEGMDVGADPARYITKHEFHHRWIRKDTAKQQIDDACNERFDMYFNFMWGQPNDAVAGLEAVQYLESKGVPFIGMPSKFLSKTKLDFRDAALKHGVRVPGDSKFPKIVKPVNGCGSLHMTVDSVCHTGEALEEQLRLLKENTDGGDIVVQDFVDGDECSSIVLEMGDNVVALTPLQYKFPDDMPRDKRFLYWGNKYDAVDAGVISYAFVKDEPRTSLIKHAAVSAFRALGVTGGGAWARVDMRITDRNEVYVLEVNPQPATFYPKGNTLGDDLVVEETFPGAHNAFVDVLLTTKLHQMAAFESQIDDVRRGYEFMAPEYEKLLASATNISTIHALIATFDMSSSVLDLGCGTGDFGHTLHKQGQASVLTGIDISPAMTGNVKAQMHYKDLHIGPVQEVIMRCGNFDHIVAFGVIHFFNPTILFAVLCRMFQLANKSVTLQVDEIPDVYNEHLVDVGQAGMYSWNHSIAVKDFGTPKGWNVTLEKRMFGWKSYATGDDVWTTIIRYEKEGAV